ncbi:MULTISPECIES: XdhC family protein [unclassified Micromonospora]|uniref:XdhC family protein n=1 Tax=unclassified Micromonospora TaxID=2617518 RepID=UPI00103472E8|nr:XdhC family protein [Verrucosispora sp. SN26_14.1]TBL33853.1 carbon monoxide dehydrogenase accessory protein [Verrucosispora sp. SN26_14.1]
MSTTIADRANALRAAREPFVHATVVRAQEPTSARPGDDAVILPDGSIEGFVGGACAENSVRAAALDTLRDGSTLLLRVLPDGTDTFPDTPGARVVVNPCHSGGAVEIFLRPMLPAAVLGVAGTSPIGAAVATLARFLDFEVVETGDYAGATAVVVAGLGKGEPEAIRAALDVGVGHVALVASRKRAAALLDELTLTDDERARVHAPAGLDIGARTPPEIALAIMADVVRAVRRDDLRPPAGAPVIRPQQAVDPVCGMTVTVGPDTPHARVDGTDHWFCCPGCLARFTGG